MAAPRKRIAAVVVVAALAAAGYYGYVNYYPRINGASDEITLYGNIDIREADLAFNVAGRVETMRVEEGDKVAKGQLLATLEDDVYQADVDAAEARLNAQRAVLDRLLAGSRPEEIERAHANVRAIEADIEDAKTNLERTESLATQSFASQQKLDEVRARLKSLEAQLTAAQQELLLAMQGPRKEDIAQARAQLKANEAELTLAKRQLDYTRLFAKDPGVINTRIVEPGAVVSAQSPVYTVALTDQVWVRTYVSETDLGRVRPGMAAEIVTDSAPDKPYTGWVGFISPVAEFTPKTVETREVRTSLVYRLRVYVRDPNGSLRQGMPVTVRLKPGTGQTGQAEQGDRGTAGAPASK